MDELQRKCDEVDAQSLERDGAPREHVELERLVRTVWRLRQEDGCPWDKEQTHESLVGNMIEEAYEAVDAIKRNNMALLREELGDVLLQVLLHAQIANDAADGEGHFDIDDVARELNQKLVRRHPHVFGEMTAENAAEALSNWDAIKKEERAHATPSSGQAEEAQGLLDSVPISLPALMQTQKISKRAAKAGFDWPDAKSVWEKVAEEHEEFLREEQGSQAAFEEFGDILFALVNVARHEHIDAEAALEHANEKFRARWAYMEKLAREQGWQLEKLSPSEQEALWQQAKAALSS